VSQAGGKRAVERAPFSEHGVKVPAGRVIVKSRCGTLSCSHLRGFFRVGFPALSALPGVIHRVRDSRFFIVVLVGLAAAACSDSTGPTPSLECDAGSTVALVVGNYRVLDPAVDGACVRLPAAGSSVTEHLYIPLATSGVETPEGVSAPYLLRGLSSPPTTASQPLLSPRLSAFRGKLPLQSFHSMLRAREQAMAQDPSRVLFSQSQVRTTQAIPPTVGSQRSFHVCSSSSCDGFLLTTATARSVGQRVAIYVDDTAPAGGYVDTDLDRVRTLFDQYLYPIDTLAFGGESDIDGNGVVIVLLTQKVNALSPDCNSSGRIILGYFFGADLLPGVEGSNEGEVFYGMVPDPNNAQCTISKDEANSRLPATFIHEFQHMISFNQHVLIRDGNAEDTWLNEGLSHFAEELGGRLIPDPECPSSTSCAQEFLEGDLLNAFEYLASPEEFFLIEPGNSTGRLEERGANWLFVRWLVDHFATDSILGTDLTRALVATNQVGSVNVTARSGVDFSTLVGEWQLSNYLDDLPGFSSPNRLRYKSWNFREAAAVNGGFPLVPDSTDGATYEHSGTLRAGSGRHVRVVQEPGDPAVDLRLTTPGGGSLPRTIVPRIALVRIR
jgi:hypothetical protein